MNVEELKARLRALLHQRDSLPLSRWIGLRDDALESLHLWWLLFSGHGLKDDKMFWSLRDSFCDPSFIEKKMMSFAPVWKPARNVWPCS